ncbi:hypothetical protein BJX63DRAFT_133982 [Aspergillus granulosus]|uniref:Uncharacterized protein n=1 Tax=Aspergillus granulosus TaxID=176169 RepID=A0ABR4GT44_9EURO
MEACGAVAAIENRPMTNFNREQRPAKREPCSQACRTEPFRDQQPEFQKLEPEPRSDLGVGRLDWTGLDPKVHCPGWGGCPTGDAISAAQCALPVPDTETSCHRDILVFNAEVVPPGLQAKRVTTSSLSSFRSNCQLRVIHGPWPVPSASRRCIGREQLIYRPRARPVSLKLMALVPSRVPFPSARLRVDAADGPGSRPAARWVSHSFSPASSSATNRASVFNLIK